MKQTLQDALDRKGYDTLTPVQTAVSAPDLEGRDMLVSAQTGSGKTIGFGLAIAPTVLGDVDVFDKAGAPLALVIAPTRELAMQVKRELAWLYADAGAFIASCVGGMDMRDERRALARGAHIVVATPGRLRDHIMRESIDLTAVRAVVLDEADEMLDLGFREDLEFILEQTPSERQTLLFSATVPRAIASLAARYQRDAERVSTVSERTQHADIEYRAMNVAPRDGENAIINVLRFYEAPNAIIFCNTRAMVSRLTARLSNRGFSVVALSGELTQSERSNALQAMRDGRARVCVATDVAARGIDLPNLDLVIHAELPNSHETLLHRSGRTGRAGRKGVSALIVPPASFKKAQRLLKFAKLTADWGSAPSADEVQAQDMRRMFSSDDWTVDVTEGESALVDDLVSRFSPQQLAAAYLRQYGRKHSAPEELSDAQDAAPKPNVPFGPSVWFSLSEGHNENASPRYLLPMLCKAGKITKDDIGAIRIADTESYIEIRESSVAGFLKAIGPEMTVEGSKILVQLDAPPAFVGGGRKGPKRDFKGKKRPERAERPARAAEPQPAKPRRKPAEKPKLETRPKPDEAPSGDQHKKPARRPKGPPPPKGKPSSKKNRARAVTMKGGNAVPKRKK
ncbi:DEAD/DEAH box helicase [Ruegeria sp. R13_0]|uniref:DEAD/DEAH box helicase n=1 Tax=Ruegeria sp. R13_0 TaxID=2821099 RepID=UPI001ADC61B4|nr:DEAD/DEAH box helicase [Ruegeria sp. R13_0]MBO9436551.1 DEAD/DEAH box helicase [Ruegeria sp. R13_0]